MAVLSGLRPSKGSAASSASRHKRSSFYARRISLKDRYLVAPSRQMCDAMMRLYEFAPTRSIRARWMLQELGEEFEAVTVNLMTGDHRRPEFLKINPAGRVPTLVDGDLVITESVAIVLYLAERDPQRRFLPRDIMLRSQVYRWLLFAATELEQPLWRIARHTALYPQELRLSAEPSLARQDIAEMTAVLE